MFARMDLAPCAVAVLLAGCASSELQSELRTVDLVHDAGIDAGAPLDGGPCAALPSDSCPGDKAHFCRLDLVVNELTGACTRDDECMLIPTFDQPENCLSYGHCKVRSPASMAGA